MLGKETSAVTRGPVMELQLYMCREQMGLTESMAKGAGERRNGETAVSLLNGQGDYVGWTHIA